MCAAAQTGRSRLATITHHVNVNGEPMSLSRTGRDRIAMVPASGGETGSNAAQIGDALVATWRELEFTLAPVLGRRGVAALYRRSLHLVAVAHPWLPGVEQDPMMTMDLAPLREAMSRQSNAAAAAAHADLLQTFHDLLASLVGSSLAERLLRPRPPVAASQPSLASAAAMTDSP